MNRSSLLVYHNLRLTLFSHKNLWAILNRRQILVDESKLKCSFGLTQLFSYERP